MTTSSSAAFPALSPSPLMVHSTCLAPLTILSNELATARPRSLWLCTDMIALSPMCSCMVFIMAPISDGNLMPTVSGRFIVLAPASMTASLISLMKPISLRPASSQLNSTSSTNVLAYSTDSTALLMTSSGDILSLCCICIGLVAIKVCMRCLVALEIASPAALISLSFARASEHTVELVIF